MGLSITTVTGKPFRRCGIAFGAEPVIVDDETLNQKFDTPRVHTGTSAKKSPTVRQVLLDEKALLCSEVAPHKAAGGKEQKQAAG